MRRKGEKGVTLTELLVVLAVISVFALITIPAFRDFMNAFKAKSTAVQIRDVVRLGRQIAVARKSRVLAQINEADNVYDAWEELSSPLNTVKDQPENSIRPIPTVPRFLNIEGVWANGGVGKVSGTTHTFQMNSDGTVVRDGAAATESQWCVLVSMRVNARRTDKWTVFMRQSGKVTLRFNDDEQAANYCDWPD